jgi:CheY-like chemotaxis protein
MSSGRSVADEARDGGAAGPAPDRARTPRQAPGQTRILVVDDDPQTLRHVRDALVEAGYVPLATGDPQELPGLVESHKPHLVLLDLLPGTDGIELMARVPELADLPVIFLSAYGRDETIGTMTTSPPGRRTATPAFAEANHVLDKSRGPYRGPGLTGSDAVVQAADRLRARRRRIPSGSSCTVLRDRATGKTRPPDNVRADDSGRQCGSDPGAATGSSSPPSGTGVNDPRDWGQGDF